MIAVIVVVVAAGDDDAGNSATTAGTGPTEIQGAATVTGITGAGQVDSGAAPTISQPADATVGSSIADGTGTGSLQRTLLEPGRFNCTDTGIWQPFAEIHLVLTVGEPTGGSSCTDDIIDLPIGYCSTAPCAEVPADWRIDTHPGVPAERSMMVVAPVSTTTAQFVCVSDLVAQPKQFLPLDTPIQQACPVGASSNSIDIPYVPPPVSVDLPAG